MQEARQPDDLLKHASPGANDLLTRLVNVMASVGSAWTFALLLLVVADVAVRTLLRHPITGITEIAAGSIVGIVFLQLAATINARRMTRADVVLATLGGHHNRLVLFLEGAGAFLGTVAMTIVAWATFPKVFSSSTTTGVIGVHGAVAFPTWPVHGLILLGTTVSALVYLRLAYHFFMQATAPASSVGRRS
jgi:TRAP-type mannitol/chloroaromatic compound transport system permease small subunit